jgi:hypothetical protein
LLALESAGPTIHPERSWCGIVERSNVALV